MSAKLSNGRWFTAHKNLEPIPERLGIELGKKEASVWYLGTNATRTILRVPRARGEDDQSLRERVAHQLQSMRDVLNAAYDMGRENQDDAPPAKMKSGRRLELHVKVPHSDPELGWGTRVKFVRSLHGEIDLSRSEKFVRKFIEDFSDRAIHNLAEPHASDKKDEK